MEVILFVFLSIAALTQTSMGQGVYYVKPTTDYPCSQQPCDTLSGYMENSDLFQNNSNSNITMMFLPGTHTVQVQRSGWKISNIHSLTLKGPTGTQSNISAHIECTTPADFMFTNISTLEVNSLSFSHCGVPTTTIKNVQVIFARNLEILLIRHSRFSKNVHGSAIFVSETKKVIVSDSLFDGNSASKSSGGAIAAFEVVRFEIKNSNFTNNNCRKHGGAIFLNNTQIICIANSTFVNNSAYKVKRYCKLNDLDCSNGGAVSIFGNGEDACPYPVTTAIFDGLVLFENNFAQRNGGGLYFRDGTLIFLGVITFHNNTAYLLGGALAVVRGFNITIHTSNFTNNQAIGGGAAVIGDVAFLSLSHCTFIENSVTLNNNLDFDTSGGGLLILGLTDSYKYSSITNTTCTRSDNDERAEILVNNITMLNNQFVNNYPVHGNGLSSVTLCKEISVNTTTVVFKGVTVFQNNSAMGDGGGLLAQNVVLEFQGRACFQNNYATNSGGGMTLYHTEALFKNDILMERNIADISGGGISSRDSTVLFQGATCTFFKNSARKYVGGGLFILKNTSINFKGAEITFNSNQAHQGGGAIGGTGITLIMNDATRVTFTNNRASVGGAIFIGESTCINKEEILNKAEVNCAALIFDNNTAKEIGGGLYLVNTQLLLNSENLTLVTNNKAQDKGGWLYSYDGKVTIIGELMAEHNSANVGGVIYGERVTIALQTSSAVITDNKVKGVGGSIAISKQSELHLHNISFVRNHAQHGGALFLSSFSRIYLYQNTHVLFRSNHAFENGGAIYVDDYSYVDNSDRISSVLNVTKECFFENETCDFSIKHIFFYNNIAKKGQDLFGGLLDRCILDGNVLINIESDVRRDTIHESGITAWSLLSNSSNPNFISSHPVRVCSCIHNSLNCTYELPTLSKYRGQMINFSAVVVDQVETPLASVIRAQFPKHSKGELREGEYLQTLPANCSQLTFHVFSPDDNETLEVYSDDGPHRDLGISKLTVTVNLLPCPLGFQLSEQNTSCVCQKLLQQFTNSCDINSQSIQREGNYWFRYENTSFVFNHHCPFDYCTQETENITIAEIDKQCAYNRSGTLCGACKTNLSLSFGSSQCQPCQQTSFVWLTLLFALAGILLVVFLLLFRFTVAIGSINGLIFYANIVAVNKALLFPSGRANPLLTFIAWLNLDVGIETCYYNEMDMYGRTWLQFIFPLYVWALVALIILVSHYSTYAARIFGRNPVSVLATLFLLSYTKLLRTIITIFSVGFIEYPEMKVTKAIWLYDGNINYLQGKHIPLFITALLFLVVLFLPYTFLLLFGQCIRRLPRKRGLGWTRSMVFTSVMDAYHAPYKNKHRYWTGLMLLVRCALFLTFSFNILGDPNVNLLAITSTIILVMTSVTYLKVYKNKTLNILELSFMINIAFLAAITQQVQLSQTNKEIVSSISVSIAFLTFIAILIYHSYIQLKDTVWRKIQHRVRPKRETNEQGLVDSMCQRNEPTSTVVDIRENYLEPLLSS